MRSKDRAVAVSHEGPLDPLDPVVVARIGEAHPLQRAIEVVGEPICVGLNHLP